MAIQVRRGDWNDFDPSGLLPGEFAAVLTNDPNTNDGRALYICFAAGDVKRLSTYDDMYRQISDIEADIMDDLTVILETAATEAHDAAVDAGNYGLRIGYLEDWAFNHDSQSRDLADMRECCGEVQATLDGFAMTLAALSGKWQYCNGVLVAPSPSAFTVSNHVATVTGTVVDNWIVLE